MTEREYDFWRGWWFALKQHGILFAYYVSGKGEEHHVAPDFMDGYVSACQYHDMPVVNQEGGTECFTRSLTSR